MEQRKETTNTTNLSYESSSTKQQSETSVYITDLLSELQTIAKIGGLTKLSDDIDLVLAKHMSGQSIL